MIGSGKYTPVIEEHLRTHRTVYETCAGLFADDNVWNAVPVLRLVVWILHHAVRGDSGTRRRYPVASLLDQYTRTITTSGATYAYVPSLTSLAKMKSCTDTRFSRICPQVVVQYSLTRLRSWVLNRILRTYENSRQQKRLADTLQTGLCHLLLSGDTVSADGFDPFRVEAWLCLIRSFVLESHVSLLRKKNTG